MKRVAIGFWSRRAFKPWLLEVGFRYWKYISYYGLGINDKTESLDYKFRVSP